MNTKDRRLQREAVARALRPISRRCCLHTAHQGPHLFVNSNARPLLGDCEAIEPQMEGNAHETR